MKKRLIRLAMGILVALLLLLTLLHFPKLFIQKRFQHNQFVVYSHEDLHDRLPIKTCLDSVKSLLEHSALHSSDDLYHLFFIEGSAYQKLLKTMGRKNMAFAFWDKQIYSAEADFKRGLLHRKNGEYEKLNMIQIITHETIHNQIAKQYSKFLVPRVPSWINEGYAEYISYIPVRKDSTYIHEDVLQLLETEPNPYWIQTKYSMWTPKAYIRDRLIMEYLLDSLEYEIKGLIETKNLNPDSIYLLLRPHAEE